MKKKVLRKVPSRSGDVLVTQRMLLETKGELKSEITSVRLEVKALDQKMDARFHQVDVRLSEMNAQFHQVDVRLSEMNAQFSQIDSKFSGIDSRFSNMESKISQMDSKLEAVIAAIHRTNALVEEQNSRNRVVLDGYDQIYRRQESHEKRLKKLERV